MIAFITCKSSLVPLLEGLCTSNPCRFEFSVFFEFLPCSIHRRESSSSPLFTRAVAVSELDVFLTRLAIERAGDYLICRPVVHDGLARLQAPRHGHVECVSRVLLHGSRPERRADGVTRLGNMLLYYDLALSRHCGFLQSICAFSTLAAGTLRNPHAGASMRWLSSMCRRITSRLLVYLHSFTRMHTSKRSTPRHCALQMCSIARNFAHQASMYVV